jgi:cold shock CspA family protein
LKRASRGARSWPRLLVAPLSTSLHDPGEARQPSSLVYMKGTVEQYDHERRFGFIRGEDGVRYVVHCTDIARPPLNQGDPVTFQPRGTPRGRKAIRVRRVTVRRAA